MGVKRIYVEREVKDKPGVLRVDKKYGRRGLYRDTERGRRAAFNRRNKLRSKGIATHIYRAELDQTGRIIKRTTWDGKPIPAAQKEPVRYPFEDSPKDSENRREVYDINTGMFGAKHTSGDRVINTLAKVGRMSAHYIGFKTQWGDDYGWKWWTRSGRKQKAKAETWANRNYDRLDLAQVYFVNHGTGPHGHLAGYVK